MDFKFWWKLEDVCWFYFIFFASDSQHVMFVFFCRSQLASRTLTLTSPLWRTCIQTRSSTRAQRTKPCWKTSSKLSKGSRCNQPIRKGRLFVPTSGVGSESESTYKQAVMVWSPRSSAVTSKVLYILNSVLSKKYWGTKRRKTSKSFLSGFSFWVSLWGRASKLQN